MSGPADKMGDYGGGYGLSSSSPPEAFAVATLQPSTMDGTPLPPASKQATMVNMMPNTTIPVTTASSYATSGAGISGTNVQIIPGPHGVSLPMSQQEKIGAKCCGCCCDYRRAVIVVAIVFIVFTALSLIFSLTAVAVPGLESTDDDQLNDVYQTNTIRSIIVSAVGLGMAVVALFGARMYNVWMLSSVVVWFVVNFGIGVWFNIDLINSYNEVMREQGQPEISVSPFGFILSAVVTALWVYPHVGLILEIRDGTMSVETYPREEYSCCCTDNRNRV